MKSIWNEGRVVGYSAYELYVKHALSVDPKHDPVSEKEWLASTLSFGSSMLLKIEPDPSMQIYDNLHFRDIKFPEDSHLCAANTIFASLFIGEGETFENSSWCKNVTDYGKLISNTNKSSPSGTIGPNGIIPPNNITDIHDDNMISRIKEYSKIIDGIIIQSGTWIDNPNKPPEKDFKPTLSECPRLRISFSKRITNTFYLLLTGFTNRGVVCGMSGSDSAVNTISPQDGDFIGPAVFPWSSKVIFSVPPAFVPYMDTLGIGNIKLYNDTELYQNVKGSESAKNYEVTNPQNYALIRDVSTKWNGAMPWGDGSHSTGAKTGTYELYQLLPPDVDNNDDWTKIPVAKISREKAINTGPYITIKTGRTSATVLGLCDANGNLYNLSGDSGKSVDIVMNYNTSGKQYEGSFTWADLLNIMVNNMNMKIILKIPKA